MRHKPAPTTKATKTRSFFHLLGGDGRVDLVQALHELLLVHRLTDWLLVRVRGRIVGVIWIVWVV